MKKLKFTPRSRVRAALRRLWLYSRERALALKKANYSCQVCGVKQSQAEGQEQKLEVHHKNGIVWEKMIDMVYKRLLVKPKKLLVVCPECHKKQHEGEQNDSTGHSSSDTQTSGKSN